MDSLAAILTSLRATRAQTLAVLAGLDEAGLERPAIWRERPLDVRFYLLGVAEADDLRRTRLEDIYAALGWRPPEAARLIGLALEVHGQLRAALVGVPEAGPLDRSPGPGEWTLRQVLDHVEQVVERYRLHTAYAVERVHSERELPLRLPDERLPPTAPPPVPPGAGPEASAAAPEPLAAWLARMDAQYDRIAAELGGLAGADLAAPTIWAGLLLDVRFRLLRFAAHERQHLVHAQKVLAALDFRQTEAQAILGQAERARGALMACLAGLPPALAAQEPGRDLPSVVELLAGAATEEQAAIEVIRTS